METDHYGQVIPDPNEKHAPPPMNPITDIDDHMAFTCRCGSVNCALLKSGKIECNSCGTLTDLQWVDGSISGLLAELQARRNEVRHQSAIILSLRAEIGKPPPGSHPDEQVPRAATWHQERLNWIAEVDRLRFALSSRTCGTCKRAYLLEEESMSGEMGCDLGKNIPNRIFTYSEACPQYAHNASLCRSAAGKLVVCVCGAGGCRQE